MLAVLPRLHGDEVFAETRVLVVVDDYPFRTLAAARGEVRGRQEAVEGVRLQEAVVELGVVWLVWNAVTSAVCLG